MFAHIFSLLLLPLLATPLANFSATMPATQHWDWHQIIIHSATSSTVTIENHSNRGATTTTINAPNGVKSVYINNNGQVYATTTSLTASDVQQMQADQKALEQKILQRQHDIEKQIQEEMDAAFGQQQKFFDSLH